MERILERYERCSYMERQLVTSEQSPNVGLHLLISMNLELGFLNWFGFFGYPSMSFQSKNRIPSKNINNQRKSF